MASPLVNAFVASCRSFSDDAAAAKDIATLQDVAEQQMPKHYRMPFPEVNLAQPQLHGKDKEQHLRGLWHELAQHLRDLRYLTEKAFKDYHKNKNKILAEPVLLQSVLAAVKAYLPEEKDWEELQNILPNGRSVDLLWLGKHLSTVVDRIGLHTCWDGSILIPGNYKVGEETVFGRALAFRLRTLSSTDYKFSEENPYYTGDDNEVLNTLFTKGFSRRGNATQTNIPVGFWTALGNIDDLVVSYVHNVPEERDLTMLYQLAPPAGKSQTDVAELNDRDFELMQANWEEYDRNTSQAIVKSARKQENRRDKSLDLRLLQIKLWQAGYYTGAIDGEWEKESHKALMTFLLDEPLTAAVINSRKEKRKEEAKNKAEALKAEWKSEKRDQKGNPKERKKLRKEKNEALAEIKEEEKQANDKDDIALKEARRVRSLLVVVNRKNQVYAADFKAILKHLGVDLRAYANQIDLLDEAELINKLQSSPGVDQDTFDEKILQEEGVGELYPDNFKKPERRVSFFRKLGGYIVGGITKIAKWLAEAAKKAVDLLLGPVFSFVKKLLRPIRAAIHRFFQGFKYLSNFVFGRPIQTETAPATTTEPARVFATRFQLDFDAMNFVPAGYEAGEPGRHADHLKRMQEDMAYFIDGVIWVIKAIGKLTNPGGWVWLGWQIMRSIAKGVPVLGALWPQKTLA